MIDALATFDDGLHALLAEASAAGPLAVDGSSGATVVLRHEDVDALAHDRRLAGVGLTFFDLMGIDAGPLRDWYGGLMFTTEGDTHNRLRSLVSRAFTPRSVDALRSHAAHLAGDAVAALAAAGGGDLVQTFARLPMKVMCRLLGVPEEDVARFGDWADALSPVFALMTPEQVAEATTAITALLDYVAELAEKRRDDPAPDLITALLAAEDGGERLSHDELVSMVANLIVGGHDTTDSQTYCTLLTLLRHPDAAAAVRDDPSLVTSAVAETIRFEPAIAALPRTAGEPVEVAGTTLPAGSLMLLSTAAANRQADVWQDPDRVDPARFTGDAPKLLSFGAGPHYCLGAALARLTIEEVVRATAVNGPTISPATDPNALPWRNVLGRAPATLPVVC